MLRRLEVRLSDASDGLAQPSFRDDAGARATRSIYLRCSYGAPWRIDQGPGEAGEIPYHAVVGGSAVLEDRADGRPLELNAGDILLLLGNPRHVLHDGSGAPPSPARNRPTLHITISENAGTGDRLDLLCGHFV